MCLSFKILNLFGILSRWGNSNYRPSALFFYEVASYVEKTAISAIIIIIESPFVAAAGLVEGGGERPPGLRAGGVRQEDRLESDGVTEQPHRRVHHLRTPAAD